MELDEKFDAALATGSIIFYPSTIHRLPDSGLNYEIRICPTIGRKDTSDQEQLEQRARNPQEQPLNPFLPFDPAMEAFTLPSAKDHAAVLFNKFALVRNHLLVVTRHYEEQSGPLSVPNFAAALEALQCIERRPDANWLVFYNKGGNAGASQPHRHFQLLPFTADKPIPLDAYLAGCLAGCEDRGGVPIYRFKHYLTRFTDELTADGLHQSYSEAMAQHGDDQDCNILFTRRWMLIVPRAASHYLGVGVNSLPFAGCIMMKREGDLANWLSTAGSPLAALQHVTLPE